MKIDLDGFDLIICVALIGGFATGIWTPLIFFIGFLIATV